MTTTTATTRQARFMANNFLGDDVLVRATSEATGYGVENIYSPLRSEVWKADGYFVITSSNCKLYFDDGSARTATVPTGAYTPATLATAIAAAVVSSGASATVVASAYSTAPYVWQLVFSTSVTLTLSTSTDAIWDTLGFTGSTDRTAATFVADAARAHTYEQITVNFGIPRAVTFFAAIAEVDQVLSLSQAATVTLMASNVDDWESPALSVDLTRDDRGLFNFQDSASSYEYEYWALRIVDRENVLGSAGIKIGHVYLGDHVTFATRSNVGIGFTEVDQDPSTVQDSDGGQRWARERTMRRRWQGLSAGLLAAADRRELRRIFRAVGISRPFYFSLDPMLSYSEALSESTAYGMIDGDPKWPHVIRDVYGLEFDLVEAA